MNTPEDPINALLREQESYMDDNGFTAQVIQKLPPRRRAWFRPAVKMGAVGIGSVLALRWLPLNALPRIEPSALLSLDANTLLPWLTVLVVAASLVWAASSVLRWED